MYARACVCVCVYIYMCVCVCVCVCVCMYYVPVYVPSIYVLMYAYKSSDSHVVPPRPMNGRQSCQCIQTSVYSDAFVQLLWDFAWRVWKFISWTHTERSDFITWCWMLSDHKINPLPHRVIRSSVRTRSMSSVEHITYLILQQLQYWRSFCTEVWNSVTHFEICFRNFYSNFPDFNS